MPSHLTRRSPREMRTHNLDLPTTMSSVEVEPFPKRPCLSGRRQLMFTEATESPEVHVFLKSFYSKPSSGRLDGVAYTRKRRPRGHLLLIGQFCAHAISALIQWLIGCACIPSADSRAPHSIFQTVFQNF